MTVIIDGSISEKTAKLFESQFSLLSGPEIDWYCIDPRLTSGEEWFRSKTKWQHEYYEVIITATLIVEGGSDGVKVFASCDFWRVSDYCLEENIYCSLPLLESGAKYLPLINDLFPTALKTWEESLERIDDDIFQDEE